MKETTRTKNKNKSSRYPKRDVFQEVTDRIMQSLEKRVAPWVKPWTTDDAGMPVSTTGHCYRGINKVVLGMVQAEQAYSSGVWYTRRMARAAGGWIRKGEKGTAVVFFKPFEQIDRNDSNEDREIGIPEGSSSPGDLKAEADRRRRWFVRRGMHRLGAGVPAPFRQCAGRVVPGAARGD